MIPVSIFQYNPTPSEPLPLFLYLTLSLSFLYPQADRLRGKTVCDGHWSVKCNEQLL